MKVLVTSMEGSVDSDVSTVFGRAPWFVVVDTADMSASSFENPARDQSSGAGIMAAQFVIKQEPDAVLSSSIGPKAYQVLEAGSIKCYSIEEGSVLSAVESLVAGTLDPMKGANAAEHSGTVRGKGARTTSAGDEEKLAELTEKLRVLRSQVAEVMDEINQLRKVD